MNLGNFVLKQKEDICYLTIPIFEKYRNLFHLFTTRKTGYNGKDLNLGINTPTSLEEVYKNYLKLCRILNINTKNIVLSDQVHEDNILIVNDSYKSRNFLFDKKVKNADGLITNKKNIFLFTLYADCTPIYFYDPINEVIGVSHSGWKGTIKEIGKKTILKMKSVFNSQPENILIALGPSIGPESFEVRKDVKTLFEKKFGKEVIKPKNEEKFLINIWKAIEISLIEVGIKKENILISNIDTYSNTDLFFSYRKEGNTGRMTTIMALIDT
ncbi:conserved hypothetical protein [Marinitoga hydrogenitolerans DSM 16785]|uniref:Purine nucleoside phosphorylase n=1 Tax=Marinitoga hydrogenitolerans (strain DSM 16785 / JCM 12826 / AT1271) TaxID=1122195 RepID=A0A1M4TBA4_MARH1|nr:peptidoglycan editing factor PgeF [Marinitoga hydrogenitolerans]SHE41723.1 conserved hypothetical protein [Marinitoga hydrogenitolerans DSM 16785]